MAIAVAIPVLFVVLLIVLLAALGAGVGAGHDKAQNFGVHKPQLPHRFRKERLLL